MLTLAMIMRLFAQVNQPLVSAALVKRKGRQITGLVWDILSDMIHNGKFPASPLGARPWETVSHLWAEKHRKMGKWALDSVPRMILSSLSAEASVVIVTGVSGDGGAVSGWGRSTLVSWRCAEDSHPFLRWVSWPLSSPQLLGVCHSPWGLVGLVRKGDGELGWPRDEGTCGLHTCPISANFH